MKTFTPLQFVLVASTALVALAALMTAGMAFGLALAGALVLAALLLMAWMVAVLVVRAARPSSRSAGPPNPDGRAVFASKDSRP